MFPDISGGKVYLHWACELDDGTSISGSEELPPEDPTYEATRAWLEQLERGEWSLVPPGWPGAWISAKYLAGSWRLDWAMNTREDRISSIQLLKQSLPELSDRAFDRMYRLAFIPFSRIQGVRQS